MQCGEVKRTNQNSTIEKKNKEQRMKEKTKEKKTKLPTVQVYAYLLLSVQCKCCAVRFSVSGLQRSQ